MMAVTLTAGAHVHAQETVQVTRSDDKPLSLTLYGAWLQERCDPIMILSHGLNDDGSSLSFMALSFAKKGFNVAVMNHPESNKDTVVGASTEEFIAASHDTYKFKARMLDLSAAYKYATQNCQPEIQVMGGYAMGAALTVLEAGAKSKLPIKGEDRFTAYIALSPQGVGKVFSRAAWTKIVKPMLMMTGTKDDTLDGETYISRLDAFYGLPVSGNKRVGIIKDATHQDLGGNGKRKVQTQMNHFAAEFLTTLSKGQWRSSRMRSIDSRDK